jgi:ubiquinone/menaquinone biosynthesis C-methylase UbiE
MSDRKSHEALVGDQFGSRAAAYLHSAVHAQGADLKALVSLVQRLPQPRVLDLGCGGGHVTFGVAPYVREVIAYDLAPEMLAVVAEAAADRGLGNVITRQGAAERLPFQNDSFDAVLTRYSAHHWRDLDAGLREAALVLMPKGIAGFVDAISPGIPLLDTYFQAIELLRDCSHVRNYTPAEWHAAIARAGLVCLSSSLFRVRLDFASWVERMRTPAIQVDAIRALQQAVSASVGAYFETKTDGSFSIDVMLFHATKRLGDGTASGGP